MLGVFSFQFATKQLKCFKQGVTMPKIRMLSGTIKDVSERDAKILIAIKKAELVQDEPINDDATSDDQPKRKYRTKTMKAD